MIYSCAGCGFLFVSAENTAACPMCAWRDIGPAAADAAARIERWLSGEKEPSQAK